MPTFNNKTNTMDGKPMTNLEMNMEIKRLLNEGQQVTMTDGQTTWTVDGRKVKTKMTDGRDAETVYDVIKTTDGQTVMTDGQTVTKTVEEDVVVASGDTGTDGQTMTPTGVEEEKMVEEADPLASSPPSPTTMMDSDDLTASHHSVVDSHPADTSPLGDVEHEVQKMDDGDDTDGVRRSVSGIARRVAGRGRVVVMEDDSETAASVVSLCSADEDSSTAASSSCARKRKGVKRGRETVKEKARTQEGSSEERKRKRKKEKEKKRGIGKKETPEKEREESVGKQGEPKGVVAHVFEDMSSSVLGGAIQEWASTIEGIRAKSKNIQGRLSGEIKKCVANIIEGAALLVVRADATGDPQFLRMRNSELVARLREVENENARLREQVRKRSPGVPSSPPNKRKEGMVARKVATDVAQVDSADPVDQPAREEFPPLPQRPPREASVGEKRKMGPRIVSDVQVVPPSKERRRKEEVATPAVSGSEAEWRVAAGSKRKGRIKGNKPPPTLPPPSHPSHPPIPGEGRPSPPIRQQQPKTKLPRLPTSSAVTITGRTEAFSYATALRGAREHIKLETLGITVTRVRKAQNGGMLIEVAGEDSRQKAEELMVRLQSVFKESAAVACPVKKRELTVVGFDESVTLDEIVEALSVSGGCPKTDVKLGSIRTMSNGLGMVWAQLPVVAAAKAAEEGRVRVGWTSARVELLKVRPLQCYKCWTFGHMQNACRNMADRRGACFRCGQKGHVASTCGNAVHCAVCHDAGLEAAHRLGGPQCVAQGSHGK